MRVFSFLSVLPHTQQVGLGDYFNGDGEKIFWSCYGDHTIVIIPGCSVVSTLACLFIYLFVHPFFYLFVCLGQLLNKSRLRGKSFL